MQPNQKASLQIGHYMVVTTSPPCRGDLNLSWREWELLQHIIQGRSTGQIAKQMGVSRHTADTFRRRVYEKLGVNTAASAAAIAIAYQSGAQIRPSAIEPNNAGPHGLSRPLAPLST